MNSSIINADCLRAMRDLPDQSIDLILTDLPYGTTRNSWDCCLPLDALWVEYRRIIKPRGCIALFAQCPFDKVLGASNLPWLRYEWIWVKEQGTGVLNSKHAPMKQHEQILIFSPAGAANGAGSNAMVYNPQYRSGKAYIQKSVMTSINYDIMHTRRVTTINDGNHYMPLSVLHFNRDKQKLHPTQKPVDLLRYLIRTYTNPGALVLDSCMGSGSTIIAAIREHRQYIGIEKDPTIFQIATKRIETELSEPSLNFEQ